MIPDREQPRHVRWFGRSEDDPNRLLIIEDEHSRVFLDAGMREELYSVIGRTRTSTRAPESEPLIYDADHPNGISFPEYANAIRAEATAAERKRNEDLIAFINVACQETIDDVLPSFNKPLANKIQYLIQRSHP